MSELMSEKEVKDIRWSRTSIDRKQANLADTCLALFDVARAANITIKTMFDWAVSSSHQAIMPDEVSDSITALAKVTRKVDGLLE
ncbi:unnamed protein product [marine sediment metagenome]|uniref:Uncharacterized protein n=1 Tax=marine sediment metagenome TaxID=412755 RepID=X0UK86_9ZZZZ